MVSGFALQLLVFVSVLSALVAGLYWNNYFRRRASYTPRWRAVMYRGTVNVSILCAIPFCALALALFHVGTLQIVAALTGACMFGYAVGLLFMRAPRWKVLCAFLCVATILVGMVIPNETPLYGNPYAVLLASTLMVLAINARRSNRAEEVRAAFEEWRAR